MFNIGDAVYMNPKYFGEVDTVIGYITSEKAVHDSNQYVIDWSDGKKGNMSLNPSDSYVLKV